MGPRSRGLVVGACVPDRPSGYATHFRCLGGPASGVPLFCSWASGGEVAQPREATAGPGASSEECCRARPCAGPVSATDPVAACNRTGSGNAAAVCATSRCMVVAPVVMELLLSSASFDDLSTAPPVSASMAAEWRGVNIYGKAPLEGIGPLEKEKPLSMLSC